MKKQNIHACSGLLCRFAPRNDEKGKTQSGNAIVLVLIGVALFGALAYTFMRGAKQGTGNLTAQQAKIAAQAFLNYGQALERGVNKLRQRGCSETQLSFANSVYTTHNGTPIQPDGHNPNAPSTGECDIFKSSGANITPITFKSYITPWSSIGPMNTAQGAASIRISALPGIGTSENDLFLFVPYPATEICKKINEFSGVTNPTNAYNLPNTTNSMNNFSGSFLGTYSINDDDGVLTGKKSFCARHADKTDPQSAFFIYVLLER